MQVADRVLRCPGTRRRRTRLRRELLGDFDGWASVQTAPGGVAYNGDGAGYAGSNSLRIENYLGRRCLHVKLSPGEAPISGNVRSRAEIASPGGTAAQVHEGSERWVGFDWRADNYPDVTATDGWAKPAFVAPLGATGTAPFQIDTTDTNQILFVENPSTSTRLPLAPVAWFKGAWHRISYRALFSETDGWVEAFIDGAMVLNRTPMRTLNPGDPMNYPKFGHYESENAVTVKESGYSNIRITGPAGARPRRHRRRRASSWRTLHRR